MSSAVGNLIPIDMLIVGMGIGAILYGAIWLMFHVRRLLTTDYPGEIRNGMVQRVHGKRGV